MGGCVPPGVPQVGESANRPFGRLRIDRAADAEPHPAPVLSSQTKGGVMLNWEHSKPSRSRPQRQLRSARQIVITARAEQRREGRRRFRRAG